MNTMVNAVNQFGICIVTTGHPYYGRMMYNLAMSIKAANPSISITGLYNGRAISHLSDQQKTVFDELIEMDGSIPASQIAKLYAPLYTPYEQTLLLDADMLWLPDRTVAQLYEEVQDADFMAITEGKEEDPNSNYYFWADTNEIREKYDIKVPIYQWRSEVVYFNQQGKEVLTRALSIVANLKLDSIKMFAHTVPDELGINIAAAEMGIEPKIYHWQPSYWHLMNRGQIPAPKELYEKYYLISFGSNQANPQIKKFYDQLMRHYSMTTGRQHIFPLESKRSFLPLVRDKI